MGIMTELSRWWGSNLSQGILQTLILNAHMCTGLYDDIPSLSRILFARSRHFLSYRARVAFYKGVAQ